jgi:predicted transcriptional regulator
METEDTIFHKNADIMIDEFKIKRSKKETRDSSYSFEPSMKIISRVMKIILEKNSIGRTTLSQAANINYTTLLKHLEWLEKKSLIDFMIEEGKISVRLTTNGREFISHLQKFSF